MKEESMSEKPQCLMPGCNQKWDHMKDTPHGIIGPDAPWSVGSQDVADSLRKGVNETYKLIKGAVSDQRSRQAVADGVASGAYSKVAQGGYAVGTSGVGVLSSPSILPGVDWQRAMHEPVPPLPPRVTLEGLAAVIGSLTGAFSTLRSGEHEGAATDAACAIQALAIKARELAGCKDETAADDEEVSVGSPSMVMTSEQTKELLAEHLRQHQALLAKEDDATYNRAITDAASAVLDVFGPFSGDVREDTRKAILALKRGAK